MVKIGNSLEEVLGLIKKEEKHEEQIETSKNNLNVCPEPIYMFKFNTSALYQIYFLQQLSSQMFSDLGAFVFYLFGSNGIINKILIPQQLFLERDRYLRLHEILSQFDSLKSTINDGEFYGWGIYTTTDYSLEDTRFDEIHSELIKFSTWNVKQDNHEFFQLYFIHLMYSHQKEDDPDSAQRFENIFHHHPNIKGYILSQYPCGNIQIKTADFKEESQEIDVDLLKKQITDEINRKITVRMKSKEDKIIKYKYDKSVSHKIDSFLSINAKVIKEKTKLSEEDTKSILADYIKFIIEKKSKKKNNEFTTTKGGDHDIYI